MPRPPYPRRFDGFWDRKLHRILPRAGVLHYPGTTLAEAAAERRRVRAWMRAIYAGPLPTTFLDPAYVLELVSDTIAASRLAGHRTGRMTAMIPIGVHRIWCASLIALPDPTGWPTIDRASIRTDDWSRPPADWAAGDTAIEPFEDVVVVSARNLYRPVLERYCIGPGQEAIEPIYRQLRIDGWTPSNAAEAATLLTAS